MGPIDFTPLIYLGIAIGVAIAVLVIGLGAGAWWLFSHLSWVG